MIDVVQYRFISGHKSQRQGAGEDTFSGLFNDSFMFNPYNRSESIYYCILLIEHLGSGWLTYYTAP